MRAGRACQQRYNYLNGVGAQGPEVEGRFQKLQPPKAIGGNTTVKEAYIRAMKS
jgi:hypothetical protein